MSKLSVAIFFGSGPVGAAALRYLSCYWQFAAVVTRPQPAQGHRSIPPVLELAQRLGLKSYTPQDKTELSLLFKHHDIGGKIAVLVDYGLIVGVDVIERFEKGIINSHFSLLPKWRGADPIAFSLLNGDPVTGVSLMRLAEKMDVGDLIAQQTLPIADSDDSRTLTRRLLALSNDLLIKILPAYLDGRIQPWPQNQNDISYSHKLRKEDGLIDWNKSALDLSREVKAYYDWPKSFTHWDDRQVIIRQAHPSATFSDITPGTIDTANDQLSVGCGGNSSLIIDQLIVAGRSAISGSEYLRGYLNR